MHDEIRGLERLTEDRGAGPALILDNPRNDNEARAQVVAKFKLACAALHTYETHVSALLEERDRLSGKLDEANYRLFYCDSEDSYLLGHRVDNFYYAHWHGNLGWVWDMSRYLPWGQTVNGFTYCSEPREIDASEWVRGFIEKFTT